MWTLPGRGFHSKTNGSVRIPWSGAYLSSSRVILLSKSSRERIPHSIWWLPYGFLTPETLTGENMSKQIHVCLLVRCFTSTNTSKFKDTNRSFPRNNYVLGTIEHMMSFCSSHLFKFWLIRGMVRCKLTSPPPGLRLGQVSACITKAADEERGCLFYSRDL